MAWMTGAPAFTVIKMEFAPRADMTEEKKPTGGTKYGNYFNETVT